MTRIRNATFLVLILAFVLTMANGAAAAYPPVGAPGSPVIVQGGTETITFSSLSPDTAYIIVVHSTPIDLGTRVSDSAGDLTVSFSTADLDVGTHTVTATAPNGSVVDVSFIVAASSTASSTSTSSTSGLAFTGAQIYGLLAAALGMIVLGFMAVRMGRRRRS